MVLTEVDIKALEAWWVEKSRVNFLAYRRFINARFFRCNWFVEDLSLQLQNFYLDFIQGRRPILIISTPPQHGKSVAVSDFISWFIGKVSIPRVIYASFSDRLGVRCNLSLQRRFIGPKYQKIFPTFKPPIFQKITGRNIFQRNRNIIEFQDGGGFFRNTTVGGPITGETLSLGVIDDPLKGHEQANSETYRQKIWDWFTDDFYTRFDDLGALLMILTPWHVDDPAHRLIAHEPSARWIKYKAIAEEEELYRKEGEALFPELKPLDFLLKRKQMLKPESWIGLYQQNPTIFGGNQFKLEHFRWWTTLPILRYKFIVADTAQKKGTKNDFTDFQLWGMGVDDNIYLLDHVHKKMEAPELRKRAKRFWDKHNLKRINVIDSVLRSFNIEDKSSGTGLIQELKKSGVRVRAISRSTDKVFRADDTIPFIEEGRVYLNRDIPDVDVILTESAQFPNGVHDDAIDNLMNAVEVSYINADPASDLRMAMEVS
jgi:predicted phage terminase large subunit-like protein